MRLALVLSAMLLGGAAPETDAQRYLRDPAFRRAALESSLVVRTNNYARTRLAHYASGDDQDWDRREVHNPPAAAFSMLDVAGGAMRPLVIPERARQGDREALRALGRAAFHVYPAQLAPYAEAALKSPDALKQYGVLFLVRVTLPDGKKQLALSCASCHSRVISMGAANDRLDLGKLMNDGTPAAPPELKLARAAWGPGRVDVTTPDGSDPVAIPDLRPIRFQTHLHHGASLKHTDEIALAVRIETLIIGAHGGAVRPPREVALGLAIYLRSLADQLPPLQNDRTPLAAQGRALFNARCATCHQPPALSGPPIAAAHTGTDANHAQSPERGTGHYRTPSLRGISTRKLFLHDGSARSLDALLQRFGGTTDDQRALAAYLSQL